MKKSYIITLEDKEVLYMKSLFEHFEILEDPRDIAEMLSARTKSITVQVIGKKIVLYKESKEHKKIELPK